VTEQDVFAALEAEGDDVDRMLADLDDAGWRTATPAEGWTVAHQIAHLTATFRMAGLAAADPDKFRALTSRLSDDFDANVDVAMAPYLAEAPAALMDRWRTERVAAEKALAAAGSGRTSQGTNCSDPTAAVLAAAGMMELFGHGQDIADALGVRRERTDRLRPLVEFAVRTWDFGYQARGLSTPDIALRFEITAPSGAVWQFGPSDAEQVVTGPAADFCLLVTRRRHRDDLSVTAVGAEAEHWLDIAQAYRGPAGPGRAPGQFADS